MRSHRADAGGIGPEVLEGERVVEDCGRLVGGVRGVLGPALAFGNSINTAPS